MKKIQHPSMISIKTEVLNHLIKLNSDTLSLYILYKIEIEVTGTEIIKNDMERQRKKLKWSRAKFSKIRKILAEEGMIKVNRTRKLDGTFGETFITITFI